MRYLKNYDYAQIYYVTRYQTFVIIKLKDTPLKDIKYLISLLTIMLFYKISKKLLFSYSKILYYKILRIYYDYAERCSILRYKTVFIIMLKGLLLQDITLCLKIFCYKISNICCMIYYCGA